MVRSQLKRQLFVAHLVDFAMKITSTNMFNINIAFPSPNTLTSDILSNRLLDTIRKNGHNEGFGGEEKY